MKTKLTKLDKLELKSIEKCAALLGDRIFSAVILSDAEDCYVEGYKDAVEKFCEWLKSKGGFTIGFPGATEQDFLEFIGYVDDKD